MNTVVVLLYANEGWFDICSEVTLTVDLSLHTGAAAHKPQFVHVQRGKLKSKGLF